MISMIKKVLALILVMTTFLCLTACGDSATSSEKSGEAIVQGENRFEERENLMGKDITVYVANTPNDWMVAAQQVYASMYGGKVNFVQSTWNDRITKLTQLILSGDSPDCANFFYYDTISLIANDLVEPIDDLLPETKNPNYSYDFMDSMYSYNGKCYGVVVAYDDMSPLLLLYNKDIFNKAGVETPTALFNKGEWNWNTFRQIAKDLTPGDGNSYGFGTWYDEIFFVANGTNPVLYDGNNLKLDLDSTAARESLQLFSDMLTIDKSMPTGKFESTNLWNSGKLAMYIGNKSVLKESFTTYGIDADFVPFPQGPSADKLYNYAFPGGFVVPKDSKNPEAALAFCEIIGNGFPEITAKHAPDFTEEQKKIFYDYACLNPTGSLCVSSGSLTEWQNLSTAIRENTPVGTAVASFKPALQKQLDDLLSNANKN